jgi:hypothetical protein
MRVMNCNLNVWIDVRHRNRRIDILGSLSYTLRMFTSRTKETDSQGATWMHGYMFSAKIKGEKQ